MAISHNYIGNDAIDNVDNYVKEWWRVNIVDTIYRGYKNMDADLNMNRAVFKKDTLLIVSAIIWGTLEIKKVIKGKE